ncbi:MAG: glutamine-hydrolyzing carbamoyl-phosphate synthase small subunit [Phycisphaerales bacterium JB037]
MTDHTVRGAGKAEVRVGRLALEDGAVFRGKAFGARGVTRAAEVVFNTAMAGYQESLTDPSYRDQVLVETFPLIGNTGVNGEDLESRGVHVAGFVVRELARRHSNFRATDSLDAFLAGQGVMGLEGVDTRAITLRLRTAGAMRGVISDDASLSDAELVERARSAPGMAGRNLVGKVGCASSEAWSEDLGAWDAFVSGEAEGEPLRVLALDCGAKRNILRHLAERGCAVTLVPATISADEVLGAFERGEADGLFLSNGPGDPAAVSGVIEMIRGVVRSEREPAMPVFGICLGHQLLSLALGASTYKLPFGHRGANQPVLEVDTGRVQITSQNHGFAVREDFSDATGLRVTHRNLNDGTVAGVEMRGKPVFGVQHHPEASPGPHDAAVSFDRFVTLMRGVRSERRGAAV